MTTTSKPYHWKNHREFWYNQLPSCFLKISLAQFTRYHNNINLPWPFLHLQATHNFLTQQQIMGFNGQGSNCTLCRMSFGKSCSFQHCVCCGGLTFIQIWRGTIRWVVFSTKIYLNLIICRSPHCSSLIDIQPSAPIQIISPSSCLHWVVHSAWNLWPCHRTIFHHTLYTPRPKECRSCLCG